MTPANGQFDRRVLSLGVVLACAGASLHYALRSHPRSALSEESNVLVWMEQYGPVWPGLFGVAALAVVVALVLRRCLVGAHLAAAAVLAGYAVALWFTAAAAGTGWVTASMTTGLAVHTLALSSAYHLEPHRRPVWTRQ